MEGLTFGILRYFYRSLGCPQLTSSSCDVRVHFRVTRQRYFSVNANAVHFASAFQNLAFP